MVKKRIISPYSMMYLVTPAIYEKLLLCIDEGDKKLLDNLNKPPEALQDKRPAQVIIDNLSTQEISPNVSGDNNDTFYSMNESNVPIVVQPQSQQQQPQVPVSVTVIPQVDNPMPAAVVPQGDPSMPITVASADTSGDPPVVVVSSVPGPPPPPPPPAPGIRAFQPIKPVNISVPTNIVRPAVLSQPVRQPRTSTPTYENVPLPDDYGDWDEVDAVRPKRMRDESFSDPSGKRFRVNEFDSDAFHVRDDRYRQRMLERAKNRRLQSEPPVFTNHPSVLPRDLVQWQPLQCVPNTTGGQICNPDPVQPPAIVSTKSRNPKRPRSESPGHEPAPLRLKMHRDKYQGPKVCPICDVKLGDEAILKLHIQLKHRMKPSDVLPKKKRKPRFTTPGIEPGPDPFVYKPSDDVAFRIKSRFSTWGSEPAPEPLIYDSAMDTSFRKPKVKKSVEQTGTKQRIPKANKYRCPICQVTLGNISLFKDHVRLKHKKNPDDVIKELASDMVDNPQPGGSRDFSNWTSLRLQPSRAAQRRQRFGERTKTKEFENWK